MGGDNQLAVRGEGLAELDGRGVDASAAAVEDSGLAVLEVADHKDIEECRDVGFTDAGGLFKAHAFRDAHQVTGVGHGVFRITATAHQADNPLAHFPTLYAWANLFDGAGDFEAENF